MFILYSGGSWQKNKAVTEHWLKAISRNSRITYIPSCSGPLAERMFRIFQRSFAQYGVKRFLYFPVDRPFTARLLREALAGDVIHLSGGNTFFFAQSLQAAGLYAPLLKFGKRRILTGLSAGSVIMTSALVIAGIGPVADEAPKKLQALPGMRAVPFLVLPHYVSSSPLDARLRRFTRRRSEPLYALPEGSGLIAEPGITTVIGRAELWTKGERCAVFNQAL